jgi:hypothetical protein
MTTSAGASVDISPIPSSARAALCDPNWCDAMQREFDALRSSLIPRPPRANIVTAKWVFKHKLHPDGSHECYKARWVVRGFTQRSGVDFGETFTLVVKPVKIRTVVALVAGR